jgi:glycosyltransferase involved in cell wall biosynthesis
MLIEAAAPLMREGQLRLDLVGDGPLGPELRALVARLGVEAAATFHGWVPHGAVQDILADAHALGLPSVREFGGGVVLEAMALGVPPIVADYAGPGELVDPAFGFKAPIGPREAIVAGVRRALEQAAADRPALAAMGARARAVVEERHTWARKAQIVLALHREAMAIRSGAASQ